MNTVRLMTMALALGIAASLRFSPSLSAQGLGMTGAPPGALGRWELVPKPAEAAAGGLSRVYIQSKMHPISLFKVF